MPDNKNKIDEFLNILKGNKQDVDFGQFKKSLDINNGVQGKNLTIKGPYQGNQYLISEKFSLFKALTGQLMKPMLINSQRLLSAIETSQNVNNNNISSVKPSKGYASSSELNASSTYAPSSELNVTPNYASSSELELQNKTRTFLNSEASLKADGSERKKSEENTSNAPSKLDNVSPSQSKKKRH